jgi:hypothetical protein
MTVQFWQLIQCACRFSGGAWVFLLVRSMSTGLPNPWFRTRSATQCGLLHYEALVHGH